MMGTITELIGGPLDGKEIDLDPIMSDVEEIDTVHLGMIPVRGGVGFIVRYRVRLWRSRLALVFDGYDEGETPDPEQGDWFDV